MKIKERIRESYFNECFTPNYVARAFLHDINPPIKPRLYFI